MSAPSRRRSPAAKTAPHVPAMLPPGSSYLQRILNARVYEVARETALTAATKLSKRLGNKVWLKREDEQPVFSFKLRGAYNKMAHLTPQQRDAGVICASAGNHAQGVALGPRRSSAARAVIVMPVTTPQVKVDAVQGAGRRGGAVRRQLHRRVQRHAKELEQAQGLTFVHPFDDPDVIAGQGTIAMEFLRQHQGPIDAIFVAIGGGGLISGVAAYIKARAARDQGDRRADHRLRRDGALGARPALRIQLNDVGLFSDGTAVKLVGEETFRITRELVDDFILVDTDAVCAAIKDVFEDTRSILEPAGALGGGRRQAVRRDDTARQGPDATWPSPAAPT